MSEIEMKEKFEVAPAGWRNVFMHADGEPFLMGMPGWVHSSYISEDVRQPLWKMEPTLVDAWGEVRRIPTHDPAIDGRWGTRAKHLGVLSPDMLLSELLENVRWDFFAAEWLCGHLGIGEDVWTRSSAIKGVRYEIYQEIYVDGSDETTQRTLSSSDAMGLFMSRLGHDGYVGSRRDCLNPKVGSALESGLRIVVSRLEWYGQNDDGCINCPFDFTVPNNIQAW